MHVHLLFVIYTLIFVNSTVASTQTLATTSLAHRHFLVITASYWRGLFIKGNGMARMKPCHLYHLWWLTDSTDSLLRHITIYVGRVGSIFDIFPYIIQLNLMSTFGRHLKLLFVLVCIASRFSADLILLVDDLCFCGVEIYLTRIEFRIHLPMMLRKIFTALVHCWRCTSVSCLTRC